MGEEERKVEEKPRAVAEREVSATFRVPVEVTQEEMLLTWTVENREERPCCFWLNYIPPPETHVPFVPLPEEDDNDEVNEGEDPTGRERVQNALGEDTSSAAVTRFLIKHLPKQLSQLRDEKVQLEDKIHDLELVVSEQRMQMAEHERRVEEALAAAKKMDHQLKKAEEERKVEEKPRAVAEREVS